jgi:hypothetical protein
LGGDRYAGAVFRVTCTRFLSGQEGDGNVGGVGVGWDVLEEVGRVRKYAIFIAVQRRWVALETMSDLWRRVRALGDGWHTGVVFWVRCARSLSEWECSRGVGGVRGGW